MGGAQRVRILGIDPGSLVVGFGCVELDAPRSEPPSQLPRPLALSAANVVRATGRPGRLRLVQAGVIALGGRRAPVEDRLAALRRELDDLLAHLQADELALEEAFYGKSVGAALRIGEARGVILAGARARGLAVHQFAPARIKRAVAGHGRAAKEAVAAMVCRGLALATAPTPRDVTDALAAAYCRAEERAGAVRQSREGAT